MINSRLSSIILLLATAHPLLSQNAPAPTPLPAPENKHITKEMEAEMNRKDDPVPESLPIPNDPNLSKVSFFRLWYLGGPGSQRISLALEDGKKKYPAHLIETSLMAGNVIPSYYPEPPGDYTLHFLDGSVFRPTDPKAALPLEEKKLQDPVNFSLEPGTYTTVVLVPDAGKIRVGYLNQKPLARDAAPEVRVRNFSTLDGWSLRIRDSKGGEKEIWNPKTGSNELLSLPATGRSDIAIYITKGGITRNVDVFTHVPSPGQSKSIILHDGIGGWGGYQPVTDAHPGLSYDEASIKAIAEGAR